MSEDKKMTVPPATGRQYPTNVPQFIADLDGGVLEQKLGNILSDVAAGVMDHGRSGTVTIQMNIKRVLDTYQVQIDHKITHKKPTARGDIVENNTTATLMHVSAGGEMNLFAKSQVPKGQMHLHDRNDQEKLVQGSMNNQQEQK